MMRGCLRMNELSYEVVDQGLVLHGESTLR
jgi:hypothetical protein